MSSSGSTSSFSGSTSSSPPVVVDSNDEEQSQTLIPNLPNDISTSILSSVPYSHHTRLKPVSKSWKSFFSATKTLISLRQINSTSSHLLCIFSQDPSLYPPYLFDPRHLSWLALPHMPCNPHVYGLTNFISISLGSYLYVIGGSLFDTRSFPMDRPTSSSSIFRFDFSTFEWERLSSMISPRGSFACASVPELGRILVAGGGSRHAMFGAAGSRMNSVECYDVEKDKWFSMDGLPRFRAGCVGFLVGNGNEMEFWVMGGYGDSRTVSGVFPVDEYYRDGVVLELKNSGKWREIGEMWEEGERRRLGNVVVVDGEKGHLPGIFMLDGRDIFRYDISTNRWCKESTVPRKSLIDSPFGFVALDGELYLMSSLNSVESIETRSSQVHKKGRTLVIQIYNPKKKNWRSVKTKTPLQSALDFKTAVMCTIRL